MHAHGSYWRVLRLDVAAFPPGLKQAVAVKWRPPPAPARREGIAEGTTRFSAELGERVYPRRKRFSAGELGAQGSKLARFDDPYRSAALGRLDFPQAGCLSADMITDLIDVRWSGRRDLNPRPSAPQADALPGCATPRRYEMELYPVEAVAANSRSYN
jgi:hypothetical protein